MFKRIALLIACLSTLVVFNDPKSQPIARESENSLNFNTFNDGRDSTALIFSKMYELRNTDFVQNIVINHKTFRALNLSSQYLNKKSKRTHRLGELTVSDNQLLQANQIVQNWANDNMANILDNVNMYQLCGEDNRGNVHITGYYVPIIDVKKEADAIYKYPLYQKPNAWKGRLPSRKKIDNEAALANRGLEICYSDDLLDNFLMQVQGSGLVRYPDGTRELLSYGGENGHRYKSIGKYLVAAGHVPKSEISLDAIKDWTAENPDSLNSLLNRNPSYVFFNKTKKEPSGAASVPLSAMISVAVDKRYIPLGSTLLAAVPVLDENDDFIGHEYRILTAQDVGGAIKGKGRMDFFCGTGEAGKKRAGALNHYGKVWLLLPK